MTATRARRVDPQLRLDDHAGAAPARCARTGACCRSTFGLLVATTVDRHRDAARASRPETEPLLVAAAELHVALSDADATASHHIRHRRAGTAGTAASATSRTCARRATALTILGRAGRPRRARPAARCSEIARELPVYTGLIETARTNSRQGHPGRRRVPAGGVRRHARSASSRGRAHLYAVEGRRLNRSYRAGASSSGLVTLAVAAAGMAARAAPARAGLPDSADPTHRSISHW